LIIHSSGVVIFFGNALHAVNPQTRNFLSKDILADIIKNPIDHIIFLQQAHSNKGIVVEDLSSKNKLRDEIGDFTLTNKKNIALGVYTADCLPIVLYDKKNKAIANIHAGWRGSLQKVCVNALESMQKTYGTMVSDVHIFFGPCAKSCCYEVKEDVIEQLQQFHFWTYLIEKRNGKYYLDVPFLNILQLQELGIKGSQFQLNYNECTMCQPRYCSSRISKTSARQITIAMLK